MHITILMVLNLTNDDFSSNQIQILKLLFEKEYMQNELQKILNTTGANLHYHLKRLEERNLVKKETVQRLGNARTNRISINPSARQLIRKILGYKSINFTLITGFGVLKDGYLLPDRIFNQLSKYYPISKIICFTSPDARQKRITIEEKENLINIDRYIEFDYQEYRYIDSPLFNKLEQLLSEEMLNANIIIDLTPLSKLFSFKMLELSNKYHIPCFYLGVNEKDELLIYSMTNLEIKGKIDSI